jgi:hypothetical protein
MAHASDNWIVAIRIAGEAADAKERWALKCPEEPFAHTVEANLAGEKFMLEADQELEAFLATGFDQGSDQWPGRWE